MIDFLERLVDPDNYRRRPPPPAPTAASINRPAPSRRSRADLPARPYAIALLQFPTSEPALSNRRTRFLPSPAPARAGPLHPSRSPNCRRSTPLRRRRHSPASQASTPPTRSRRARYKHRYPASTPPIPRNCRIVSNCPISPASTPAIPSRRALCKRRYPAVNAPYPTTTPAAIHAQAAAAGNQDAEIIPDVPEPVHTADELGFDWTTTLTQAAEAARGLSQIDIGEQIINPIRADTPAHALDYFLTKAADRLVGHPAVTLVEWNPAGLTLTQRYWASVRRFARSRRPHSPMESESAVDRLEFGHLRGMGFNRRPVRVPGSRQIITENLDVPGAGPHVRLRSRHVQSPTTSLQ